MRITCADSLYLFSSPPCLPRCHYCGAIATVVCNAFLRSPAAGTPDQPCRRACCANHSHRISQMGDTTVDLCEEHHESLAVGC